MKILTTTLKNIWNFIDSLNTQTKTVIIFIVIVLCFLQYSKKLNENIILDYIKKNEQIEQNADNYTIQIAPLIHDCITSIQKEDKDCYDVLLLNYHNSKKSIQGIRYLYLNCISESTQGIDDVPLKQYWSELEYIYYQDELSRIHSQGYLRVNNIDSIKTTFPKLYSQLYASQAKAAAFYPVEGINSSIGIVVLLYKQPKVYRLNYYGSVIAPSIQKLSTILDYPNLNFK